VIADIGRRFLQLLIQAIEHPVGVDRGALLNASSAFLDAALSPESDGLTLARRMAFRACEWCTMDRPLTARRLVITFVPRPRTATPITLRHSRFRTEPVWLTGYPLRYCTPSILYR